jgi:8-oxo-dGTP diphosphatase
MSSGPLHSVSVAAVIAGADGRVLAVRRRDNGHWEPPGGVLELDESVHDGLRREVEEETGLLVEPGELTGVYKNLTRGVVALVFRCEVRSGSPRPTAESAEVAWLTVAEVSERMAEVYAVRVLDALSDRSGRPAVRSHDGRRLTS